MKQVYLLYGEERFKILELQYELAANFLGDISFIDSFEGSVTLLEISNAASAMSFFSDKRFILIKDSKLFQTGQKDETEAFAKFMPNIPENTIICFSEIGIDKRNILYKTVEKHGQVIECKPLSPNEISTWASTIFEKHGKSISQKTLALFIKYTGSNMSIVNQEAMKLIAYAENEIKESDIKALVKPILETNIFQMLKNLGTGKTATALKQYKELLQQKEEPIRILAMIIRQLRHMLLCKLAYDKNLSQAEMAKLLGLNNYTISESISLAKKYTIPDLIKILEKLQELDYDMKTGNIIADIGVEVFMTGYK